MEMRRGGYRGPVRGKLATRQYSHGVWKPSIPSWEKEFCHEIGLFTWENFLEAKRNTIGSEKVLGWDDAEAEDAFHNAKKMFRAKKFNEAINYSLPSPDLYIDKIDWEENMDVDDHELEDDDVVEEKGKDDHIVNYGDIPVGPTGWEDDGADVYFSSGKVLYGLIIGC